MRILFVYSVNSLSGQNKIVQNQAKTLVGKEIKIEHFQIGNKGLSGYFKNVFQLSNFLADNKFDIIHAHYGLSGIVSFFSKKKERLVVSFMGSDLICSNRSSLFNRIKNGILITINVCFARYFYDHTIVKSTEMGERLIRNTKYSVIPNGVFLQDFYPLDKLTSREKIKLDLNQKIVLFASDPLREEKNYSLSCESVKLINDGTITLKTIFNQPLESLLLYYNAADVILITSFHEGSPNVIKEAMSCNCPVVSTKVGDVEWLFNGTPGYFITNFEPEDVARNIKLALNFRENHFHTKGRDRIIEIRLDSETIAQKIIAVYNRESTESSR